MSDESMVDGVTRDNKLAQVIVYMSSKTFGYFLNLLQDIVWYFKVG